MINENFMELFNIILKRKCTIELVEITPAMVIMKVGIAGYGNHEFHVHNSSFKTLTPKELAINIVYKTSKVVLK